MTAPSEITDYAKVMEWLRVHRVIAWVIFLGSGAALVASHYQAWVPVWAKSIFLLVFVFSGCIATSVLVEGIGHRIRKRRRLHNLSETEKAVLRRFLLKNSYDCVFLTYEEGVDSLEHDGILSCRLVADPSAKDGGVRVCRIDSWVFNDIKYLLGD